MRKIVLTMITLFTSGAMQALPVGNPREASLFTKGIYCESGCIDWSDPCFSWCDAWSVRVGFYGNYVYNRHAKIDGGSTDGAQIDRTFIFTNAGYLALNICDRFDIFATLGATNIEWITDLKAITAISNPIFTDLILASAFSWSVGGRATLWECNCFTIGLEGEYFQTSPHFDRNIISNFVTPNDQYNTQYREWQVGLGAAYTIATRCPSLALIPYLAATWSGFHMDSSTFEFFTGESIFSLPIPNFENAKRWGYVVGTTITLFDVTGITVEGRFGSEKALYVNGQLRF